jgi:hypothetical protein
MKKVILTVAIMASILSTSTFAKNYGSGHFSGTGSNSQNHYNHGYTKQNGTYVAPHYSTNPNRTQRDNYNARGNYNPHNGQYGKQYVGR